MMIVQLIKLCYIYRVSLNGIVLAQVFNGFHLEFPLSHCLSRLFHIKMTIENVRTRHLSNYWKTKGYRLSIQHRQIISMNVFVACSTFSLRLSPFVVY